ADSRPPSALSTWSVIASVPTASSVISCASTSAARAPSSGPVSITIRRSNRRSRSQSGAPLTALQGLVEIVEPVLDAIELRRELRDLHLRLAVDREVQLAAQAILRVLPVLTHHDDRRLHRG